MKNQILILSLLCLLFPLSRANSQVGVMPPGVFIEPQTRSGSMTLTNNGNEEREVEISFKFGYPMTDGQGRTFMNFDDTMAEQWSLVPYLKVFPRKLILGPKREQTVRFIVQQKPDMPDGTYWTRVSILSRPVRKQIDTTNNEQISAGFLVQTELVNIVVFQKGQCNTGISLSDIKHNIENEMVTVDFNLTRFGNSPYWGNLIFTIMDSKGDVVEMHHEPIAIYYSVLKRFQYERSKFPPGKYTVDVRINNQRDDIPTDRRLRSEAITQTAEFTIN